MNSRLGGNYSWLFAVFGLASLLSCSFGLWVCRLQRDNRYPRVSIPAGEGDEAGVGLGSGGVEAPLPPLPAEGLELELGPARDSGARPQQLTGARARAVEG